MLPNFQSPDIPFSLMQSQWAKYLNPLLANPLVNGIILPNITLSSGLNIVNHRLGRNLQGWIIVMNNASATFYDSQATNQQQNLTLALIASAPCTVNIYVF